MNGAEKDYFKVHYTKRLPVEGDLGGAKSGNKKDNRILDNESDDKVNNKKAKLPQDDDFKFDKKINEEKFPKFIEAMSKIRDEVVETYPLLVLGNLDGKQRTPALFELLNNLSMVDKDGKIMKDKLQMIKGDNVGVVVGELKKMMLRDYRYLTKILKQWKKELDSGGEGWFIENNIDINKVKGDVKRWLEELQKVNVIRKELMLNNMPLVTKIAQWPKYERAHSFNIQDIINFGVIGLNYAVNNFSLGRGMTFSSYARQLIISTIDGYVFPDIWRTDVGKLAKRYIEKQKEFELKNGRMANEIEMANILKVEVEEVVEVTYFLERNKQDYYLDNSIDGEKDGITFKDFLTVGNNDVPEYLVDKKLSKQLFWKLAGEILGENSRELRLLKIRNLNDKTLEELRGEMTKGKNKKPISKERVRQIEKKAKNELRQGLKSRGYKLSDFQF